MNAVTSSRVTANALNARTFAQWKNGLVQIWGIDEAQGYCRVILLSQHKSDAACGDWADSLGTYRPTGNSGNH